MVMPNRPISFHLFHQLEGIGVFLVVAVRDRLYVAADEVTHQVDDLGSGFRGVSASYVHPYPSSSQVVVGAQSTSVAWPHPKLVTHPARPALRAEMECPH